MPARPRLTLAERRRRLLEQARLAFARRGYAAAEFELLASAAGLTPSTAARAYADLPTLARAVVGEFHGTLFSGEAASDRALDMLQALGESFRTESRNPDSPVRAVLALLAEGHPEARDAVEDALGPTIAALAELVRAGQQEGVFRRTLDPQSAAWELLRALFGQALFDGVEPPPPADPEHPEQHFGGLDVLLHGLLKTDV